MTSIATSRLEATFTRCLGARFFQGLLGPLLLELINYAVRWISVLALFKKPDKREVIVRQSFMRLRILLLMLSRHQEKDLLDPFLLGGQVHCCMQETLFEVAHELHSAAHVVMHGHECRLSSGTEPVDQLVANVREPRECFEIILLAFDEIVEHLALVVRTACRNDVQPFGQTDLLEALLHEWKQRRPIALLVRRHARNDLRLEVGKRLHEEELGAEASLVGCDASR